MTASGKKSAPPGGGSATIGIAWYSKAQWDDFRRLSTDPVEKTFEEWERNAKRLCAKTEKKGVTVKKIPVDVSELALWCHSTKRACDGAARADYVAWKLREPDSRE